MDMDVLPFCRLTLNAAKPKDACYPSGLNTLGDHLRARRLNLGLFQKDVASRIICTVDTITNWELNRCQPEIQYIPRIIEFLGYDPIDVGQNEPIGQRLRKHRQRMGLSLKQTAMLLETDASNLQHWETGRHRPTKKSVALICEFLSRTAECTGTICIPQSDPDIFS